MEYDNDDSITGGSNKMRKSVSSGTGLDLDKENSGKYDDNFNNGIIISTKPPPTTNNVADEENVIIETRTKVDDDDKKVVTTMEPTRMMPYYKDQPTTEVDPISATNGSDIGNSTNVPFSETAQQQLLIPDISNADRMDTNSIEFNNNNNNDNNMNNNNKNNNNTRSESSNNNSNNPGLTEPSTGTHTVVAVPVKPIVLVTAQLYNENNNNNNNNDGIDDNNINDNLESGSTRRKYYFYLLLAVIITVLLIGVGIYLRNDRNKTTNSSEIQIMEPSNVPTTSPTISHIPTIYQKPFQDGTELMNVVDKYLFNTDMDEINATYGPIEEWDVSNVTDFSLLFSTVRTNNAIDFNADLSKWDMRSATNINLMFNGASKFNADLSEWDVSNVQLISGLFQGATNFQSDLSRWNVSSAQYTVSMFGSAVRFNSDLSKWDVSNVLSMDHMFANATSFRSDLSRWNVSSVTDMSFMFCTASNFVSDLSKWDISSVTSLLFFAEKAANFNTDVSKWNTSKVDSFTMMFQLAGSFQGIGIDRWDVRTGVFFNNMFTGARNFDANLSKWDTSNAITMEEMFAATNTFRGIGLEHWNLAKVTSTRAMFYNAIQFDCNVSDWDVSNIANMTEMFARATVFQGIGLDSWQLNETTETMNMFCGASALNKTNIVNWNVTGSNLFC